MRKKNYLDIQNALQVGTDSEGGYLVPDEYERTLVEALEEENLFPKSGNRDSRPPAEIVKFLSWHPKEKQSGLMKKRHIQNLMTALDRFPLVHIRLRP